MKNKQKMLLLTKVGNAILSRTFKDQCQRITIILGLQCNDIIIASTL
jgi:hypothetical protein